MHITTVEVSDPGTATNAGKSASYSAALPLRISFRKAAILVVSTETRSSAPWFAIHCITDETKNSFRYAYEKAPVSLTMRCSASSERFNFVSPDLDHLRPFSSHRLPAEFRGSRNGGLPYTITQVPAGSRALTCLAANIGTRMQPWL